MFTNDGGRGIDWQVQANGYDADAPDVIVSPDHGNFNPGDVVTSHIIGSYGGGQLEVQITIGAWGSGETLNVTCSNV
jgi:hypothetical protein